VLFHCSQIDQLNTPLYEQLPKKSTLKELKIPIDLFLVCNRQKSIRAFFHSFLIFSGYVPITN